MCGPIRMAFGSSEYRSGTDSILGLRPPGTGFGCVLGVGGRS